MCASILGCFVVLDHPNDFYVKNVVNGNLYIN